MIHIDVKKLGRIQGGAGKRVRGGVRHHYNPTFTDREGKRRNTVGWDYVHIAIDDATRLAYAEVLADEKRPPSSRSSSAQSRSTPATASSLSG